MSSLDDIDVFLAIAETGGFAAAARRLGVTAAAVSKAVARLESRLGARLFHRTTRKVSLSEAGETYYRHVRPAYEQVAAAAAAVRQLDREPEGRLRVAAPMSFGLERLAAWVPGFLEQYPGLMLDLNLDDRTLDLVEGAYDLAIRIGSLVDSSLVARRLGSLPVWLVASPAYIETHGNPRHPHDLQQHNCLLFSSAGGEWRFRQEQGDGEVAVKVNGNYRVNSSLALRTAAIDGAGIARIPDYQLQDALERSELVRVLDHWMLEPLLVHAVMPTRAQVPAKVRLFIDFIESMLASSVE